MEVLAKRFYVYIAMLTAELVNLLNFMVVATASDSSFCILHAHLPDPSRIYFKAECYNAGRYEQREIVNQRY